MLDHSYFQTRSELNGIKNEMDGILSIKDCILEARRDPTVWKISFFSLTNHKIRCFVRMKTPGFWKQVPVSPYTADDSESRTWKEEELLHTFV